MEYLSVFKNPQAEAAYMAAYDSALEKWPMPYETKYVPTAYGDTYMIVSGPVDGEPPILVHGAGSNASHWSLNVAALAQNYRVYALDIMGSVGRSRPINFPRPYGRGISSFKLRLPCIFFPLIFDVCLDNCFINPHR